MNRYQIYLQPQDVSVLDRVSQQLEISRSDIIRDVVSRVSHEFRKVLQSSPQTIAFDDHPLRKMVGLYKGKPKSKNIKLEDRFYLYD